MLRQIQSITGFCTLLPMVRSKAPRYVHFGKCAVLFVCKWVGLFWLAARITKNCASIVYYHSFDDGDLPQFRPKLFMRPETLEKRIGLMKKYGKNVISIDTVWAHLNAGKPFPPHALVITIDDGWYGVLKYAHPILKRYQFPYTLYVTSYYAKQQTSIFNIAIPYILWKSPVPAVDLKHLSIGNDSVGALTYSSDKHMLAEELIAFGERELDATGREKFLEILGRELKVDFPILKSDGRMRLLSQDELIQLDRDGVNIQLHTHRHRSPVDRDAFRMEIDENRQFLEKCSKTALAHFCFPGGEWSPSQCEWLGELGIKTATTCDFGLNTLSTSPFLLRRYIDGEDITSIEAEARISGFYYLFRRCCIRKYRSLREDLLNQPPPFTGTIFNGS